MNTRKTGPYSAIERYLGRKDPALRPVLRSVGPCTLRIDPDHFGTLVRSVLAQQISVRAAMTIADRLGTLCGGPRGIRPETIASLAEDQLRACGISRAKSDAIRGLARHFAKNPKSLADVASLSDAEVAERLLHLRGIGPWTVEMFLIFSLGRLDILPVGDFGLRAAVQTLYGLDALPAPKELLSLAEKWRPYRTIVTWYCWKSRGPVPQS